MISGNAGSSMPKLVPNAVLPRPAAVKHPEYYFEDGGGFCFPDAPPRLRCARGCVIVLLALELAGIGLAAAALGTGAKAHEGGAGMVFLSMSLLATVLCSIACAVVVCCCQTRCSFSCYSVAIILGTLLQLVGLAGFGGQASHALATEESAFECKQFSCFQLLSVRNLSSCTRCGPEPNVYCDPRSTYDCTMRAEPGLADCGAKWCAYKIDDCARGGGADGMSLGFDSAELCANFWRSLTKRYQDSVPLTLIGVALGCVMVPRVFVAVALMKHAQRHHTAVNGRLAEAAPLTGAAARCTSDADAELAHRNTLAATPRNIVPVHAQDLHPAINALPPQQSSRPQPAESMTIRSDINGDAGFEVELTTTS